jgi:hypothetical protein
MADVDEVVALVAELSVITTVGGPLVGKVAGVAAIGVEHTAIAAIGGGVGLTIAQQPVINIVGGVATGTVDAAYLINLARGGAKLAEIVCRPMVQTITGIERKSARQVGGWPVRSGTKPLRQRGGLDVYPVNFLQVARGIGPTKANRPRCIRIKNGHCRWLLHSRTELCGQVEKWQAIS